MPHCNKQMISFFLTTKCNLNCIYCYNADERSSLAKHTLSLDIAKAGIDYFFATNSSRHIRFYGPGEPTQEFQLMKQITEYAKLKSNLVTVELQSNGVFGSVVRSWILDNVDILWVSFDGPPDIQNHNRPISGGHPSAPVIENNIRWFINNKTNQQLMVGARVTITDKNINRQKEMVDYFFNLGIRYIWTDPLFPAVGDIPVCKDFNKQKKYQFDMDTYVDNYIDAYYYAKDMCLFYGSFLMCNFDGESNIHCRACTPVPHLTPDGYVSACDMVVLGEDAHHMDCFIYGKWDYSKNQFVFSDEKISCLHKRSSDNMSHCKNCDVQLHCGGYCLGEVVNETGELTGQKIKTCKAIKRLYKELGTFSAPFDYLHP